MQTGAALAALSVGLGAFAAHLLKDDLPVTEMQTFDTAVRYQFFHSLAILFMASFLRRIHEEVARKVFTLFITGIIFFSGSLYLLSTRTLWIGEGAVWLGILTPLGGISLISGWLYLAIKGFRPSDGMNRHPKQQTEEANYEYD